MGDESKFQKSIAGLDWSLANFSACLMTEEEVKAELDRARDESNFVVRFEGIDNGVPYTCVVHSVQWELREKTDEPKPSPWSEGVPIVEGDHCTIVKMGTGLPLIPTGEKIANPFDGSDGSQETLAKMGKL